MDQILVLILFALGVPICVGLWLIVRAISARSQIEELDRRVTDLQQEIARLKQAGPSAPVTAAEKAARLTLATLPAKKEEPAAATGAPAMPMRAAAAPAAPAPPQPAPVSPVPVLAPLVPPPPPPVFDKPTKVPPVVPPSATADLPPLIRPMPDPNRENAAATAAPAPAGSSTAREKSSFEMQLGTYWIVRIGIVMVLASLAFFANFAYHNIIGKLGPGEKVSLLYLASAFLLGAGAWWQRRSVTESIKNYGQVLFAGGLAAVYFTTYAAYHIPPLRLIGSALLDGALLLAWAAVIAWIADRRKSEVMALFAIGLGFFTSVMTRVAEFTLYSNLILTIAAVVFLVRNRWVGLSFASLAASYAGYAFWRFLHDDGWRWASPDENLQLGAAFLAGYWIVFTAATFLSRSEKLTGSSRATFLTLNNGAYFSLFLLTMLQVHTGGFWKFSLGFGTVLIALAALAAKLIPAEPMTRNAYLVQGLALVTVGFISKFTGLQLALVLGAESMVLFVLALQRQSSVLRFFAYASALLASAWCAASLRDFDSQGLWAAVGLGFILGFNAFWAHRYSLAGADSATPQTALRFRRDPTVFTLLAFTAWLAATWRNCTPEHLPLALAAEAVVLTASIYCVRMPEVTLLGQVFLILAQIAWLVHFSATSPPWWNTAAIIIATVALSHWWQYQKVIRLSRNVYFSGSGIYALAAVAMALVWLAVALSPSASLAVAAALAAAVTVYGVATRAWMLAICGQLFLAFSVGEFFVQLMREKPEWFYPLAPLLVLAGLSAATLAWFKRRSGEEPLPVREPLLQLALFYRWLALGMSLMWVCDYVPERERVWVLMSLASGVFALGWWRKSREALVAAAVYAAASLALLWLRDDLVMDVYWPSLLALLAPLVMQQILRRPAGWLTVPEQVHGAVVFLAGCSLWRFVSCWTAPMTSGFFVTMTWAGFAVVVFSAGIVLRERFMRWLGLGVLAAAIGRVVVVDVWKQETIARVLTFLALGVALLLVGFIYNKYQEKIRQWL